MTMSTDERPHSRACGVTPHEHGTGCHANCPTCGGRPGGPLEIPTQELLDQMRKAVEDAETNLWEAVAEACPGAVHQTTQHRDAEPPWCNYCGRTDRGALVGGTPATTTRGY